MVADDVIVQSPAIPGSGPGPAILQHSDPRFLDAVLAQIEHDGSVASLQSSLAHDSINGVLKLYQPIHRTSHLALLEVSCNTFGLPRLDPTKIESAGLVIRRIASDGGREGWRSAGTTTRGWVPFTAGDLDADPDPAQRREPWQTGNAELDRQLLLLQVDGEPLSEDTSPLFPAPPEVCEVVGRTILHGVLPLASTEVGQRPAGTPLSRSDVQTHLARYLVAADYVRAVPHPGETLGPDAAANTADSMLQSFISSFLQQVALECDAFGSSANSATLLAALNEIALPMPDGTTTSAGTALQAMTQTLLYRQQGSTVTMPLRWPPVSDATAEHILNAVVAILGARLASIAPHENRFADPSRRYRARAFVRARHDPNCPPAIFWSDESQPFSIAPWFDHNDGVEPVQIVLPDINKDFLKNAKPNVSFVVPPGLMSTLQGSNLKGLIDGSGSGGDSSGWTWICSFNLPVITICAFLVLNIFLSLFDLIFGWLAFIKICIPIRK